MQLGASFKLGPFTVDAAGRLSPCDPATAPAFLFRWHDRIVRARLDSADTDTGRLILQVTLARVRSSASTPDEMLRPRSFALLRWRVGLVHFQVDRKNGAAVAAHESLPQTKAGVRDAEALGLRAMRASLRLPAQPPPRVTAADVAK
jgi:hypothetical protein